MPARKPETPSSPHAYEQDFVNSFVLPKRRERSLFELHSPEKRKDFFSKLCHGYERILDARFMETCSPNSPELMLDLLHNMLPASCRFCSTMAYDEALDRQYVSIHDGLAMLQQTAMSMILVFQPSFAMFQAEAEHAKPRRFFLRRA